MASSIACGALAALLVGCVPTYPSPPHLPFASAELPARAQLYRDYSLSLRRCGLGYGLGRRDGTYTYQQLEPVLQAYPRSARLTRRAHVRDEVLATTLLVGLALVVDAALGETVPGGYAGELGYYVAGGALVTGSALAAFWLWPDPTRELPATYDEELRTDLALSPDQAAAAARDRTTPACPH